MIRRSIPTWLFAALSVAGVVICLATYAGLSKRQTAINPEQTAFPWVGEFQEGWTKITKTNGTEDRPKPPYIFRDLRATYWRLFLGLSIGISLSIVLGVAMGAYRWLEAPLMPAISFLSKIPPTAMMPIYFVIVGTDQTMFASMIALGIFFTMAQAVYQAARKDVRDAAIQKAYTLGASEAEVLYEVLWKQILPRVIETIRLQIGPAMVFLLAAEMLVGGEGMGYRIRMESRLLNMSIVYIYLAILGFSGLLFEWILVGLRRWLCPWFGE
jgi:NitT/TauT family transport system permease protein